MNYNVFKKLGGSSIISSTKIKTTEENIFEINLFLREKFNINSVLIGNSSEFYNHAIDYKLLSNFKKLDLEFIDSDISDFKKILSSNNIYSNTKISEKILSTIEANQPKTLFDLSSLLDDLKLTLKDHIQISHEHVDDLSQNHQKISKLLSKFRVSDFNLVTKPAFGLS